MSLRNFMLLCMVIMFLLLCSCTVVETDSYTPQVIYYTEENSAYSFRREMECTETELARFCFESAIEEDQRRLCIEATEAVLRALCIKSEENLQFCIYTAASFPTVNIQGHTLSANLQNWRSVDYVTSVLLTAYGECTHYGTAYGYAVWLCEKFGWQECSEVHFIYPDEQTSCDLNLLCFDPCFVSEHDAAAAEGNSCLFVRKYIAAYGDSALQTLLAETNSTTGMENLALELTKFYEENNMTVELSRLCYGFGGLSYQYIVRSELAVFYIGTDWIDRNWEYNPLVTESFLHMCYPDLREFFETNVMQMEQYQELFALEEYDNDLHIILENSKRKSNSYYQSGTHQIHLYNVDSLMHEYIHALTQPEETMESWMVEGFARYFSYRFDRYGIAFLNQNYNQTAITENVQYVCDYLVEIGRPIDMSQDYASLENYIVQYYGLDDPNENYAAGSSFVQYLVQRYGENYIIQHLYVERQPLDQDYAELIEDWNRHIADIT